MRTYQLEKLHMGRLVAGDDLLTALTGATEKLKISSGYIWALGTVKRGVLGFFDQDEKEYVELTFDEPLEIVTCHGSISRKGDDTVLHLHMTVGDELGQAYGGHVMPGNEVLVTEFCIAEFDGEPLCRERDEELDLDLWPLK